MTDMSLFSKKQTTDSAKEPYLDQIHARPEVKPFYVINEWINFFEWLVGLAPLVLMIVQASGATAELNLDALHYLYLFLTTTQAGIALIVTYVVLEIGFEIAKRILQAKLVKAEDAAYRDILLAETRAEDGEELAVQAPATKGKKTSFFSILKTVQGVVTAALLVLLFYLYRGVLLSLF
jgi:hypothetical protein